MHNSIIKPFGYSGFARRIFLGERLLIECISKAFMCQILAYMIYNSPKFVFLLFNSCPKSIICVWTLKADSMARFFFFKHWTFCIVPVVSTFVLNVNNGQTLSHNQQALSNFFRQSALSLSVYPCKFSVVITLWSDLKISARKLFPFKIIPICLFNLGFSQI